MAPAAAPVVETVAEIALSMRKPLHLPPVNVAPPVSSITFWPGASVVAVSVSPAVNVPPHALPTKEAVNWESLSDMTNMMLLPTVNGCPQSSNDGWPRAARRSRRNSIGENCTKIAGKSLEISRHRTRAPVGVHTTPWLLKPIDCLPTALARAESYGPARAPHGAARIGACSPSPPCSWEPLNRGPCCRSLQRSLQTHCGLLRRVWREGARLPWTCREAPAAPAQPAPSPRPTEDARCNGCHGTRG